MVYLLQLIFFIAFALALHADAHSVALSSFQLSNTLGDHMVLQRDTPAMVWGFATPAVTVKTGFLGQSFVAVTGSDGVWRQRLPAQPYSSQPTTITFASSDGGTATLSDVLFGDVHICSGQSNMQFTLTSNAGVPNKTQEISDAANYPLIRVFTVGQGTSSTTPLSQLKTIEAQWNVSSPAIIGGPGWNTFSAVCWFTYRDVFKALGSRVPMGLISNNWGGTPIQKWASPAAVAACGGPADSTLYNAMIHPYLVGPMSIRTVIWYQGEANVGAAAYYACQQPVMVQDWRKSFAVDFTFGFVVIAPCNCYHGDFSAADLRQSQLATLGAIPKVAFSIATDLVYPYSATGDIHPVNKQDVSQRLANQILTIEYGQETVGYGIPLYAGQSVLPDGSGIRVSLTGCGVAGCKVQSVTPPPQTAHTATFAIQVADANRTWLPAQATVTADGQGLVLTPLTPITGSSILASSYGRADYPLNAATNALGMPVAGWCFTVNGDPCYSSTENVFHDTSEEAQKFHKLGMRH